MKIIKTADHSKTTILKTAIKVLTAGGLVIYPTETVYGAGVDATNQTAVKKLLAYKSRREGKPLSIAVASTIMAQKYAQLNSQALSLHQKFLPGPYTIISKAENNLADGVASEFGTIGIRIPDHELVTDLTTALNKPITATSANISGKKRPYTIQDIFSNLSTKQRGLIDLVIDAGELPPNEPSTVIDTTLSTPLTIRGNMLSHKNNLALISCSDQETIDIAGKFLLKYWDKIKNRGLVIGLNGELGAGKTMFAKGIGQFLKIPQLITSPTYTYIKKYSYNRHNIEGIFYHIDTWKIDQAENAQLLEIEGLIKSKNIVAIEWWTQIEKFLPEIKPQLIIDIQILSDNQRQLTFIEKP